MGDIINYNYSSWHTIGDQGHKWSEVYTNRLNNGNAIIVPTIGGTMAIQVSSLPTASSSLEGNVYHYLGSTTENYIYGYFYKCVSNGSSYSWEQLNVQPSSGSSTTATTGTLVAANWSSNTQTINVTGVTASNNVIISPAPVSQAAYTTAGVLCTAQGAGTLTFTCTSTPASDLTVNVLII